MELFDTIFKNPREISAIVGLLEHTIFFIWAIALLAAQNTVGA